MGATNSYRAGENDYTGNINTSLANNSKLQDILLGNVQGKDNSAIGQALLAQLSGGGPNLAQQQFQNSTQQLQNQAAGQIGSLKGISPAAQARLVMQSQNQIGQGLAGQAAASRLEQQLGVQGMLNQRDLAAKQMLSQNTMGTTDTLTGRKLGAQQINAGVTNANAANQTATTNAIVGGGLNGAGAAMGLASGGEVPADAPRSELGRALMGATASAPVFMSDGGVPGTPTVPGDSPVNDRVPAMLSPGEVVIPRTVAQSPDAPEAAASFIEALQRRNGGGYAQVAAARMACGGQVGGYAEGGEVEDDAPGLIEKAKALWASVKGAGPEDLAKALPSSLGGDVAGQLAARRKKIEAAGRE